MNGITGSLQKAAWLQSDIEGIRSNSGYIQYLTLSPSNTRQYPTSEDNTPNYLVRGLIRLWDRNLLL